MEVRRMESGAVTVSAHPDLVSMLTRGRAKDARGLRGAAFTVDDAGAWLTLTLPPARFADLARACDEYRGILSPAAVLHEFVLCLSCGGFEDWPAPLRGLLRSVN